MRLRFRAHIAFFLLLTCVVHVFPVKWLHECHESATTAEAPVFDLAPGTPSLSTVHLKCQLCDFQVSPFIRILHDFRIETPDFSIDFAITALPAPELPSLHNHAPRAPPLA